MLVGEAPGRSEDAGFLDPITRTRKRIGFIGPAGQVLWDILSRHGVTRSMLYVTNVIKQRPPKDRDPTPDEIREFRPILLKELREIQPPLVVAAGGFATRFFLGPQANLELMHGLLHWSEEFSVATLPCFHPASMLHESDFSQVVFWDYERAAKAIITGLPLHDAKPAVTTIIPLPEKLLGSHGDLGIDTEDDIHHNRPLCLTISMGDGLASYVPFDDHEAIRRIAGWLRDRDRRVFIHFVLHDLPVLAEMGLDINRGLDWEYRGDFARVIDTMVLLFEAGRITGQGLKAAAYRKLSVRMQAYEDLVGPVEQQRMFAYLLELSNHQWSVPEQVPHIRANGTIGWSSPWGLNRRIDRILADFAEDPETDLIERWENIDPGTRAEAEVVYGPRPLADLSDCPQEAARHYACQDADMTRQLGRLLVREHEQQGLMSIAAIDHAQVPMIAAMEKNGLPAKRAHFVALGEEMRRMQAEIAEVLSAVVGREINPNSSKQVADLLYEQMKMVPLKTTPGGKPSTGKKALQHLRQQNALVGWILQSREYGKTDDAFCEGIAARIRPDPDGSGYERAYYTLQTTRVKTGRLASRRFNALAISGRSELGKRLRHGFECREGRVLASWDLSQIEMRCAAHRSHDSELMRIYSLGHDVEPWQRDVHLQTASRVFGCHPQDVTKAQRTACKSTGFGILMGITERGLVDQMVLYGLPIEEWPEDRCAELIREWLDVHRGVRDYQMQRRAEARRTGRVVDIFGRQYALPGADCPLSWIRDEAARQSHALDIQGMAQAIEKRAMARIDREVLPAMREMGHCQPVLQVHDELLFELDEDLYPVLDPLMVACLTTTTTLDVPIEASGAWARDWGSVEKP